MRFRGLLTLFFILSQTAVLISVFSCPESSLYPHLSLKQDAGFGNGFGFNFGWIDLFLVCICLLIAIIQRKRNSLNETYRKRIALLRTTCLHQEESFNILAKYVEDSRGKYSTIENPIRKINRASMEARKQIVSQISQLENIKTEFDELRSIWAKQKESYPSSNAEILKQLKLASITAEIKSLKEYIDREVTDLYNDLVHLRVPLKGCQRC